MHLSLTHVFCILVTGLLLISGCASADGTITITDITDRQVEIPSDVTRVVTVDPFSSQFIYVIGADDRLVGTCIGPANRELVNKTQPRLGSLPSAGCKTNVNLEELMKLNPDLVISSMDYTSINNDIERVSIPLVQIDLEKAENLVKSYEIIGKIFGKEKEAQEFIDYYNQKMDAVKETGTGIPDDKRKSIYFGQRSPLQTLGDDYYEAEIARIIGASNAAKGLSGGDNTVTMEQVYEWDPSAVVLLPYCPAGVADILADPAWQSLPAVKEKQVFRMPKYLMSWELPVPESILGTLWLQSVIYPESVSFDMKDEIKNFYQKFYRIDLSDEEVENIFSDQTQIILNKPSP